MTLFRKTAQVPAHTQVPVPHPTSLNVTNAATATRRQCAKRIAAWYTLKNLILSRHSTVSVITIMKKLTKIIEK